MSMINQTISNFIPKNATQADQEEGVLTTTQEKQQVAKEAVTDTAAPANSGIWNILPFNPFSSPLQSGAVESTLPKEEQESLEKEVERQKIRNQVPLWARTFLENETKGEETIESTVLPAVATEPAIAKKEEGVVVAEEKAAEEVKERIAEEVAEEKIQASISTETTSTESLSKHETKALKAEKKKLERKAKKEKKRAAKAAKKEAAKTEKSAKKAKKRKESALV